MRRPRLNESKGTTGFQNGLIWFGAAVSIAEILTGTYFAPLGFGRGFLAIVIGHVIGCGLFFLAGLIGGCTRRSAMETVKMSFRQWGGLLFAALNVLQLAGWTVIMIYDGAQATGGIFAVGHWVWCLVIGGQIADFFILKRDRWDAAVDWRSLAIWAVGFVSYRLLMRADISVGSTLPAMALTIALCWVVHRASGRHQAHR